MFGLNRAEVIGRLGADVVINHLVSGGRVANMSIATDESYLDRSGGGERIEKTEWHRIVTFQPGLVDMPRTPREEGPAGLRVREAADAALEEGRGGVRPVLPPRSCWPRAVGSSSWSGPTAPTRRRPESQAASEPAQTQGASQTDLDSDPAVLRGPMSKV